MRLGLVFILITFLRDYLYFITKYLRTSMRQSDLLA